MREFVDIGLGREGVHDATTQLKFRLQLAQHGLIAAILTETPSRP